MIHKFLKETKPSMVHWVSTDKLGVFRQLKEATMSSDLVCDACGSTEHHAPYMNPSNSDQRVRICTNPLCSLLVEKTGSDGMKTLPRSRNAIPWPVLCENNGIGDTHHDVRWENIKQSAEKMRFLEKWISRPSGVLLLRGAPGTGKTYASMGMMELWSRTSPSCAFYTHRQLQDTWTSALNESRSADCKQRLKNVTLLIVDDFGLADSSAPFMSFFTDLLDSRQAWKDRGTVITTNLDNVKFSTFCGEALTDRILTGQLLNFSGPSRRGKK